MFVHYKSCFDDKVYSIDLESYIESSLSPKSSNSESGDFEKRSKNHVKVTSRLIELLYSKNLISQDDVATILDTSDIVKINGDFKYIK